MTPYDLLFADQPLDELLLATELPAGGKLDVARSRMWEGRPLEAADLAAGASEPWATFIVALARIHAGQSAVRPLRAIAEDAFQESRARLFAWSALRTLGEKPSRVHAQEVLGCVVEVPVDGGLDVLAAYADGSARYLGHADQLVLREAGGAQSPAVASVISEAFVLLGVTAARRDPAAEPPPPDQVRLSALSAHGVHQVTVPWAQVEVGGTYERLFVAAVKLLDEVTRA